MVNCALCFEMHDLSQNFYRSNGALWRLMTNAAFSLDVQSMRRRRGVRGTVLHSRKSTCIFDSPSPKPLTGSPLLTGGLSDPISSWFTHLLYAMSIIFCILTTQSARGKRLLRRRCACLVRRGFLSSASQTTRPSVPASVLPCPMQSTVHVVCSTDAGRQKWTGMWKNFTFTVTWVSAGVTIHTLMTRKQCDCCPVASCTWHGCCSQERSRKFPVYWLEKILM